MKAIDFSMSRPHMRNTPSATKVFVGSLAWATDDSSLRSHFEKAGTVTDARVILDRDTGRSRGFGFVTFANQQGADAALLELNGSELDGRPIRVDRANEKPPRR